MKISLVGLVLLTLAGLTGCTQGTPGGPGTAVTTVNKPVIGQADDTFTLSVPTLSTSLQQGGKAEATIGIKRAKNFDADVVLQFAELPQGVTVDPSSPMIKHGDSDAKIIFRAADRAALGNFAIKITGRPAKGGDALVEFKLSVLAKDSFTLSVPFISTSLKQGESQTVAIGIKRDTQFDQDVALKFGKAPNGVTLEPASAVIKHGDKEIQVRLTAAADAALGEFTIPVTGHPGNGVDVLNELKIAVTKKETNE